MKDEAYNFGFYTAAWCVGDNWNTHQTREKTNKTASELALRKSVPFEFLGKSALRYGSQAPITLVMLEGYNCLSEAYITELENLNFKIINYEEKFRQIISRFPNIDKRFNVFERNCFLRWLAFSDIAKSNGVTHVLHIDSDLVLYTSLEEIAMETRNKTFVLEGCPAFTSISQSEWFNTYERELRAFEANIIGYSEIAATKIEMGRIEDNDLCNTSMWRNPIGSDQDLLEYLIANHHIPQNTSKEIFDSHLFFIENPLLIQYWAKLQGISGTEKIIEKNNGALYYGPKKIAFTHYQGTFSMYANIFAITQYYFPFNLLQLRNFLYFKIEGSKFRIPQIAHYIWKAAKIFKLRFTRKELMKYMESDQKREKPIVTVLNFIISSKKNTFTK